MVKVRQHGSNNELFDISVFLSDIDELARPDTWHIRVDQCIGDRAAEIEQLSSTGYSLSDSAFRSLYQGIHQTIDGCFIGLVDGERLFELQAVDSTFWEVTGSPGFESHMLAKYGAWQRA